MIVFGHAGSPAVRRGVGLIWDVVWVLRRWLRGLDYNLMPEELLAKCDPIRRQLLGDGVDVKGWWQPTEEDVPLKGGIRAHRGEEYLYDVSKRYKV